MAGCAAASALHEVRGPCREGRAQEARYLAGGVRLRRARHDPAAIPVLLRRATLAALRDRPQARRRPDHDPGVLDGGARRAGRRVGSPGRPRLGRAGPRHRPDLERRACLLSRAQGAGRHRPDRRPDALQFLQRRDRRPFDAGDGGERRAEISDLDRGAARHRPAPLRAVPGRAGQRSRLPQEVHDAALRRAEAELQGRGCGDGRR